MDCLPPELLKIVFRSFSLAELSNAALVCKDWKRILYKTFDSRWKTLRLTGTQVYASNRILLQAINGEHNYEELELDLPPISWKKEDLLIFHKKLPSLKYLAIWVLQIR